MTLRLFHGASLRLGAALYAGLLVVLLLGKPAMAAGLLDGRWAIDAGIWESSYKAMVEQMLETVPEDQRDEMRMAMQSQLEQLKDPGGGLARVVSFQPDGTVSVEGGDDQILSEGSHWTLKEKEVTIATDDPTDLAFAGPVEGDMIDLRPILDKDAQAETPWSRQLHLVLRRVR